MFEPSEKPRIFALPPGVDFPAALVDGLTARMADQPPEAMARVQLITNTRRMARRIAGLFDEGPALLLPQIQLVTDLGDSAGLDSIPPAVSPLKRRLELVQLVSRLLGAEPDLAPRSSLYDLADSLANLMAEMQGEGVAPEIIANLDITDQSGHWARSQRFLSIVQGFFADDGAAPDHDARQRQMIEAVIRRWRDRPPEHPVIIAGSTGSRGATQLLMQAVARLPQGAVILPGFDFHMPRALWQHLDDPLLGEDHPQYRFHALIRAIGAGIDDITPWVDTNPPEIARNRLVSLALRPAPVTDQWLTDGPGLADDIAPATARMTLVQADSPRDEALTIALRLRKAAEDGITAALITPDRGLTRQVSAALDRWGIIPDDSAGLPLQLSPIGRLLRHLADLFQNRLTAESLLTCLSHPLTHSADGRGDHLRHSRDLELDLRRNGPPFPTAESLREWAARRDDRGPWAEWVIETFTGRENPTDQSLKSRISAHLDLLNLAMRGANPDAVAHPWDKSNGHQAKAVIDDLIAAAPHGGALNARDYIDLLGAILAGTEVREVETPHPQILIWGTLEARVQGADLLILAGLNEGSWPEAPAPDPWLNRALRHQAGLLLPERRIGLSAHDFQQAIAAPEIWLTRATRSDEAETVASRWLARLTSLLAGLKDYGGNDALNQMINRGDEWLALARAVEAPTQEVPPEPRPAPRPPVDTRPRKLSVTQIKTLIRDPYAIYARHVLKLRPLDPLMATPDALLRGNALHEVMEKFVAAARSDRTIITRENLMQIARDTLADSVPWPTARLLWLARFERIVDDLIAGENARAGGGENIALERFGEMNLGIPDFTLTTKADRIDRDPNGTLLIYDYKTGKPPTHKEQRAFDKQLLLETVIAENGGFTDIPPTPVSHAAFLGLGSEHKVETAPLDEVTPDQVLADFRALIAAYLTPEQGYQSRRAMAQVKYPGDYDHLARLGEWDMADAAQGVDLT